MYLVTEYDNDKHALEVRSQCYDIIFELELGGWHLDESAWPKNRSFKMFLEWFSLEFNSVVEDKCGYGLLDDEEMS